MGSFFRDYLTNEAPVKIDTWQEQIRKSVEMDNVRWYRGEGYAKYWPHENGKFTSDYDFDEEADFLRNWIRRRREFLDSCWAAGLTCSYFLRLSIEKQELSDKMGTTSR